MKKVLCAAFLILLIAGSLPVSQAAETKTKDELQRELADLEKQISQYENELKGITGEKKTLSNRLAQLKKERDQLNAQIQATSIKINTLDTQLGETKTSIDDVNVRLEETKVRIAEVVRSLHEKEQRSLIEVLVLNENLSEALGEMEGLNALSSELTALSFDMQSMKSDLEGRQEVLSQQQEEAENLLAIQNLQRGAFSSKISEQDTLVRQTQGKESSYQELLADSRKRANEIRSRLYEVAGGTTTQVNFGEAVNIAQWASSQTGVRPALLLAILTQESNLGKNVGTCNRAGDPPEKSWQVIMHPTRDKPLFEQIVKELGLDPNTTPLSCPMVRNGQQIGYGGAMGPAQFIPSTWVGYKGKVSAITGKPANPWDIRDAFLASALLLKANGATQNGEDGEWAAAMRYFSGGTNPAYRFYGDNVLALARRYQADIDALSGK